MFRTVSMLVVALLWFAPLAWAQAGAPLQVGQKAPDFRLMGSDGKYYTLSEFQGQKAVVIAWFPKAFTGG